jgi:hypothetical protein
MIAYHLVMEAKKGCDLFSKLCSTLPNSAKLWIFAGSIHSAYMSYQDGSLSLRQRIALSHISIFLSFAGGRDPALKTDFSKSDSLSYHREHASSESYIAS